MVLFMPGRSGDSRLPEVQLRRAHLARDTTRCQSPWSITQFAGWAAVSLVLQCGQRPPLPPTQMTAQSVRSSRTTP